jgi:hypothetical protein
MHTPWKDPTLYVLILAIAGRTKVLLASFFPLTAPLPIQDVSGGAQTHLGGALYTLWILLCTSWTCNGHHPSLFFEKKMNQAKGRQRKKKSTAYNNKYVHI